MKIHCFKRLKKQHDRECGVALKYFVNITHKLLSQYNDKQTQVISEDKERKEGEKSGKIFETSITTSFSRELKNSEMQRKLGNLILECKSCTHSLSIRDYEKITCRISSQAGEQRPGKVIRMSKNGNLGADLNLSGPTPILCESLA